MSNMPRLPQQEPFPVTPEDQQHNRNQPPVTHPLHKVPGEDQSSKPKQNLKQKGLLIVALLITILAVGTLLLINLRSAPPPNNPDNPATPNQPTPTPTQPAAAITDPSEYYNDPEILQLEAVMKQLNAQIDTTDLLEPELDPPSLETKISF